MLAEVEAESARPKVLPILEAAVLNAIRARCSTEAESINTHLNLVSSTLVDYLETA